MTHIFSDKKKYLYIVSILIALSCVVYTWTHINLFHIDFGGHIASTAMFQQYGFHGWNPNWFHGLINNLFYPPLEDIVVWLLSFLGLSHVNTFLLYVSLLIGGYRFAVVLLLKRTKHFSSALGLFVLSFLYFFLNKTQNISYFQGGGFFDLLVAGLTSESFSVIFLLLFLYEFLSEKTKFWKLSLWSIFALLSHLVVGPLTFFLLFLYAIHISLKKTWCYLLAVLGVTSFFWLPFLLSKNMGASSHAYFNAPIIFLIFLIILLIRAYKKQEKKLGILLAAGLIVILPNYLSMLWGLVSTSDLPLLPAFHYYRFATLSLLLSFVAGIFLFDAKAYKHTLWLYLGVGSIGLVLLSRFGFLSFGDISTILGGRYDKETDISYIQNNYTTLHDGKKILTVDVYRPIDFGVDSYFQYSDLRLPFVKGLFWESSRGNQLLSSYLATLFAPRDIVLDYYVPRYSGYTEYSNLRNSFIENYDIGWLFVSPKDQIFYMSGNRLNLFESLLSSGTSRYSFQKQSTFLLKGVTYTIYKIQARDNLIENTFVRRFTNQDRFMQLSNRRFFADTILTTYKDYTGDVRYLFFDEGKAPGLLPILSGNMQGPSYTIVGSNSYKIDIGSIEKSIVLNIPDLPGRHIEGLNGQKVSVFDGLYQKVVISSGVLSIYYEKPRFMKMAYVLSLSVLSVAIYFVIAKKPL